MNRAQQVVVICGLVAFLLMGLFPPWTLVYENGMSRVVHSCIFDPPRSSLHDGSQLYFWPESQSINIRILIFQWFVLAVTTGGLARVLRQKA